MDTFRKFYIDNGKRLFGYLLRKSGSDHVAADLVQESFVRYLDRYRKQELSVPLLFTNARNIFHDHVRKQQPSAAVDSLATDMCQNQEHLYIVREEAQRLLSAMQQLNEEDRDILSLVVSSGLPYREIAAIRGCSEANVKVRVHRARQKLRQLLPAESL